MQDNNNNNSSESKKLEVTPTEETKQNLNTSFTITHSPNETESVATNDSTNSNVDSNLIVKTSADGKIEDIISPVAVSETKPFQKKDPLAENYKTPSSASSERIVSDQLNISHATTVKDPITNKLNHHTSLKRKRIPPPLASIQTNKRAQNKNQLNQNLKDPIQDKYKTINTNQNLKKPRVQYLGKIPFNKRYSKFSTIPYLQKHRTNNYSSNSMYHSQRQQQQQQYLFSNLPTNKAYPMSAIQPLQMPHFPPPLAPFPASCTTPFSTSNTSYIPSMPPYIPYCDYYQNYYQNYFPYSTMPINTDTTDPTLFSNPVPSYPQSYDDFNNSNNNNNNGDTTKPNGSQYSIKLRNDRNSVGYETELNKNSPQDDITKDSSVESDEDNNDDNDDNDNIEESDLAIEEGAVPTPIFTRFQHDAIPTRNRVDITKNNNNNNSNSKYNNNVMFGEIRILDNRYSFEYPQGNDKDMNKKIFMSICNQIWNECQK